jgi:hypothetical protein
VAHEPLISQKPVTEAPLTGLSSAANRAWVPVAKLATLAMTAPGRRIAGMLEQTAPQTVE